MIQRWLRPARNRGVAPSDGGAAPDEQKCPGLARALERILAERERPEVLDLGQFSRSAAIYLADRGARVSIEDFRLPEVAEVEPDLEDAPAAPPLVIRQPDQRFDLVLAWEHPDFVPPDRLDDFGAEIRRVLAPGGWLLLFSQDEPGEKDARPDRPGCYRLTADDRIVRTSPDGPERPRWAHTNRHIERALEPLTVQSIHLQRNRVREFLARKPDKR